MTTRNPNGVGYYFTRTNRDGSVRYCWRTSYLSGRKEISASSQKLLKQKVKQWKESIQAFSINENIKCLADFIPLFLQNSTVGLKQRTLDGYELMSRKFLSGPPLGDVPFKDLTPMLIEKYLVELCKTYSAEYVSNIRRCLHTILNSAVKQRYIYANPCSLAKGPKKRWREIRVLTRDEIKELLRVAKSGEYLTDVTRQDSETSTLQKHCFYTALLLTIYSGVRIGECFGLSWDNVDFETNTIYIKQSLTIDKNGRHLDVPKTPSSIRKITLPKFVMQELRIWKGEQQAFQEKYGNIAFNEFNLVFPTSKGTLYNIQNIYRRYWSKLLIYVGLPKHYHWHYLRHTHASMLLKAGIPITEITTRLGHRDSSVTLRVYSHAITKDESKTIKALEDLLGDDRSD